MRLTLAFILRLPRTVVPVLELVYPRGCLACDRILTPEDGPWCPDCVHEVLQATAEAYCPRCGTTAEPHLVDQRGCRFCRGRRLPVAAIARAAPYDSVLGHLVRRYKYQGHQHLDRELADLLTAAMQRHDWIPDLDALVPVPTTIWRTWHYRFYPVGLLARHVGRALNVPVWPVARARGKRKRQVELPVSARAANVRGVYDIIDPKRIADRTVCIVDDVATTNATLYALARALTEAGAKRVFAAFLCKASAGSIPAGR